jgi:hypothetical protein
VEAEFRGPDGYVARVESSYTEAGSAKIAVPPFVNPESGAFGTAEVNVSIAGFSSDQTVVIESLPLVDESSPGFALELLLESAVEQYDAAVSNLAEIEAEHPELDSDAASTSLAEESTRLAAMLVELRTSGRLTVTLPDGSAATLGAAELTLGDRWVVAVLRGMEEELGISGKSSLRMQMIPGFGDVQESINGVLSRLRTGLNGGSVLLGVTSLGVTVIGLLGGSQIAAVAGAFGLAITIGSSVYSWGVGVFTNSNSDSLLGLDRPGFDAAQEFLSQAARIAASFIAGLSESALSLANAFSTALTTKDTLSAAEGLTRPVSPEKRATHYQAIEVFCSNSLPPDEGCTNTCAEAFDDICDDGGPGALYSNCDLGTDCADCGPRDGSDTPTPSDPTGACCSSSGCTLASAAVCDSLDGQYLGDTTTCDPEPCVGTEEYVVWYTGNVCCWGAPLLYLSERSELDREASTCSYPGGGIDCTVPLERVVVMDGFATIAEAQAWVCPRIVSQSYHYWCGAHYQMDGQNWQPTGSLGCDLSGLPEPATYPEVDGCQ